MSQGDVDRAKAQLKCNVLKELATPTGRFNDLVAQALNGQINGKSELAAAIDAVSVADVNAVSVVLIINLISTKMKVFSCTILSGGEKGCIRQMVNWRCR